MCRAARMAEWEKESNRRPLEYHAVPEGFAPCSTARERAEYQRFDIRRDDGRGWSRTGEPAQVGGTPLRRRDDSRTGGRPIADDLASVVDRVGPGAPIDVQRAEVADASVLPDHGS